MLSLFAPFQYKTCCFCPVMSTCPSSIVGLPCTVWHCWLFLSFLYLLYTIFRFISYMNVIIALAWLHGAPAHTLYRKMKVCLCILLRGCSFSDILSSFSFVAASISSHLGSLYYSHSDIRCMEISRPPHIAHEGPFAPSMPSAALRNCFSLVQICLFRAVQAREPPTSHILKEVSHRSAANTSNVFDLQSYIFL
jgi:hypothetical protein